MSIDSNECKAIRAQTGLSQAKLAQAANVSTKTISDFEKGKTTPQKKTLNAIHLALEEAGGSLPSHEGGTPRVGGGASWVTASDLSNWADTQARKMQALLPDIIRRLALATTPDQEMCDFPTGDSTYAPGWDGKINTPQGNQYVPDGRSGWEMGCDKKPTAKANEDIKKRKNEPLGLAPKDTAFVFVTPRRWKGKARWIADRQKERFWADVCAMDADDLEQWLGRAPHVAIWLAKEMGKYTSGVMHISEFWEGWQARTNPALNSEAVLSGRDNSRDSEIFQNWITSPSGILAVQGETEDEAKSFLAAALETLPTDPAQNHFHRCLVVEDQEAFRSLIGEPTHMIIAISKNIKELAGSAVKLGHHVFIPLSYDAFLPQKNALPLPIIERVGLVKALTNLGYSSEKAEDLCNESGRSLSVLQRRLGTSRDPNWATPEHAKDLVPALLAGAWRKDNDDDKRVLSDIAGIAYSELDPVLVRWTKEADPSLRRIGAIWRHTSRQDAWHLLSPFITASNLDRLAVVIKEVLGARDPSFDTPPKDRWRNEKSLPYSKELREGLAQTLILIATQPDGIGFQAPQSDPQRWVDFQVRNLLHDASEATWYSLASLLPLIAEAAPEALLTAVEDSLEMDQPSVMQMFEAVKSEFGFGDSSVHSSLLRALEGLAWDPMYLTRVTAILGELEQRDPGGHLGNRPTNSLKKIYILWLNHTHATLDQRMAAIDHLAERDQHSAWKLLLAILPTGHNTSSPPYKMRWRGLNAPPPPIVTLGTIRAGANAAITRLLKLVGSNIARWHDLLEKYEHLPDDSQHKLVSDLTKLIEGRLRLADTEVLSTVLRKIISKHRKFPDADWSLDRKKIPPLVKLYERMAPSDPIERYRWLFDDFWPPIMSGARRREGKVMEKTRGEALQTILDAHGIDGLFKLACICKKPDTVGQTVAQALPPSDDDWCLLSKWLNADAPVPLAGRAFINIRARKEGGTWAQDAVEKLRHESNRKDVLVNFFMGLPMSRETWNLLEKQEIPIQNGYWEQVESFLHTDSSEDLIYAVDKFIGVDRPKTAFNVCAHQFEKLPAQKLLNILDHLTTKETNEEGKLDKYDIEQAFEALDAATDITVEALAAMEWKYAEVLGRFGNGRGTKALHRQIVKDPSLFITMLKLAYKHEDEHEQKKEKEGRDIGVIERQASHAFQVLRGLQIIPGAQTDGSINKKELMDWIDNARDLAAKAGRKAICDNTIGQILAHAPEGEDGAWPIVDVCEAMERTRSRELERGFRTGVFNKRGIFSRSSIEGGVKEYELASNFRQHAGALESKYPQIAAVLRELADGYEGDARREDDRARNRDLEY